MGESHEDDGPVEIAIVGDLTDSEAELTDRLLGIEPGGECTIYFDSPGGSPYCAVSLMTLIKLRDLRATGIVTGECSSATLWPFAACKRRIVTPYSVMLFHPMRWQSEENVGLAEAAEWARGRPACRSHRVKSAWAKRPRHSATRPLRNAPRPRT